MRCLLAPPKSEHEKRIAELEARIAELQRRLEKYEAREQADKETLHEFTEALAHRRKLKEEG